MRDTRSTDNIVKGQERYEKIRVLYSTPTGATVELHRDLVSGDHVAIKCFERGSQISSTLKRGILNHMSLRHQHIVAFKEVFLTPTHLCVVLEYAAGGDVLELAMHRRMSESQVRWLFQQLIVGLDYCHKMGIVSRNISLDNTLLDDSTWPLLKINAFMKSKRLVIDEARYRDEACASCAYIAPELLSGRDIKKEDFKEVDIWACGVYLYVMLFQQYPFYNPDERRQTDQYRQALIRTMECKFTFPANIPVSEECKDLMSHILTLPKKRFSLEDIMKHSWFLKDLPEGALQMNSSLRLRKSTKLQSKEEIIKMIDHARMHAPSTDRSSCY